MQQRKAIVGLIAGLILGCFLVGCGKFASNKKDAGNDEEKRKERPVPVEVASLESGSIESVVQASATLVVERVTPVYARTANLVREILVEEGDRVEKGQVLLLLEDDIQRTTFDRAQVQFDKAERDFTRNEDLYAQGLISDQVFQDVEFQYKERRLALEDAQREYEYTKLTAPISGIITSRDAKVGFPLNIGSSQTRDGVFTIMDFNTLQAEIYLPEKLLSRLKEGLQARVSATPFPDRQFQGTVRRISPVVEAGTGTVKVTIGFEEPGPLLPGMYVDVELVLSTKDDALLIPKRAVVYDNESMFVYRLKPRPDDSEPRRVERLLVVPALMDKNNLEPQPGVFEVGDQVVIAGQTGLKNDAIVRLPGDPVPADDDDENEQGKDDKKKGKKGEKGNAGDKSDKGD